MRRDRLAWLVSLALMTVGGLIAHALAYRLVASGHGRPMSIGAPDHGQGLQWQICIAACGAVVIVGLVAIVFQRVREESTSVPLWLFALLPPVGFAVQEHIEYALHVGAFPLAASFEPTFVVGILLQLPFALAAYFAARCLLALAFALALRLGADARPRVLAARTFAPAPGYAAPPRVPLLFLGHGQRAPPLPAPL